ncbi:exonuclease domain-containing protein [Nocardiopsis synnemataformans]|uniref:exonuclease domain-containing protein n=1 Tax=Nocardiopsis synnemataformans TaxID=61305 RepID=UPI003EBD5438
MSTPTPAAEHTTSPWMGVDLIAFDAETTGPDPRTARIVSWSRWNLSMSLGRPIHAGWLLNPGVEIPQEAIDIHGITNEHVRERGQQAASGIREIAGDLIEWAREGKVPVAFNAAYDLTLLRAECLRHGHADLAHQLTEIRPVADPFVLDKVITPRRSGKGCRKLTAVADIYQVPLGDDAHGSQADSLAAARVFYKMLAAAPRLAAMTPDQLHDAQITWFAEQQTDMQAYFTRIGKAEGRDFDPAWPIRT